MSKKKTPEPIVHPGFWSLWVILLLITLSKGQVSLAQEAKDSNTWMIRQRGQFGGSVRPITVQGNYVYLGQGSCLVVVDISDPSNATTAGKTGPLPGLVFSLGVNGNYLYASSGPEMVIFDISFPASPQQVGSFGKSGDIFITDQRLILTAPDGIYVLDIGAPANPVTMGTYPLSYGYRSIAVGDRAYVLGYPILILDISDPGAISKLGEFHLYGTYNHDIAVSGNFAIVACHDGVYSIDISDPAAPKQIHKYPGSIYRSVAVSGNYVYMGNWDHLYITTLSSGGYLYYVAHLPIMDEPGEIVVDGDRLLVSGPASIGNPSQISLANGMAIVSVANPVLPQLVGVYQGLIPNNLDVVDGKAYFINSSETNINNVEFGILDVADPENPTMLGSSSIMYHKPLEINDLEVKGNYAYLAHDNHLDILNVTNPGSIQLAGVFTSTYLLRSVEISGEYAYLAETSYGLRILDISDPSHPTAIGGWPRSSTVSMVRLSGVYAILAGSGTITWVDISDPHNNLRRGLSSLGDRGSRETPF